MPAIIQAVLDILAALPAAISAVLKIIGIIKGQPTPVQNDAIQKGVAAVQAHVDKKGL